MFIFFFFFFSSRRRHTRLQGDWSSDVCSSDLELYLSILGGGSPFVEEREIRPFWALDGGEIVARAAAVIDRRYQRHWGEALGHVIMFEALPASEVAVAELMDAASQWLASRGTVAARAG